MKWFARFNNFNLSKDIYDPAKFNSYPNVDLNNKPFACGELATSGSIHNPDFLNDPTQTVVTAQYYNNYDISHHNEIWGSAFIGNFHSGFTWFTEVAHRYYNSNPFPPQSPSTARNLNDLFLYNFPPTSGISDINTQIISTYHNFKPFSDFISSIPNLGADINFNSIFTPFAIYNYEETHIETYYIVDNNKDNAYGWVHNIDHYWNNEYYFDENNYHWGSGFCTEPTLSSFSSLGYPLNLGLPVFGLNLGSNYELTYFYTRMGVPTAPFLPSSPTLISASFYNSNPDYPIGAMAFIPANEITDFIACDTTHADFAFKIKKIGMRGEKIELSLNEDSLPKYNLFPNPTNDIVNFNTINDKSLKENGVYKIEIVDLSNKIIYISNIYELKMGAISLKSFSSGIYLLKIYSNYGIQYNKIVKL